MVKKAVEAAETLIKFTPRGCKLSDAALVTFCFGIMGFAGGLVLAICLRQ